MSIISDEYRCAGPQLEDSDREAGFGTLPRLVQLLQPLQRLKSVAPRVPHRLKEAEKNAGPAVE